MSHNYTALKQPLSNAKITPQHNILCLGSCFSQSIGKKLHDAGWNTCINPFGIIYNVESIERILDASIDNSFDANRFGQRKDLYLHYDVHSKMSTIDKDELQNKLKHTSQFVNSFLQNTDWLIITLGTSIVYKLYQDCTTVSNCHKMPKDLFFLHSLSIAEMVNSLINISNIVKTTCNIIVTVSPIRHIKNGLILNSRSKARLIEAVHQFVEKVSGVNYFPSYEIQLDELRDYRYYKQDLLHPSDESIDVIWEKFGKCFFDDASIRKNKRFRKFHLSKNHKAIHENSSDYKRHMEFLENEKQKLIRLYPEAKVLY